VRVPDDVKIRRAAAALHDDQLQRLRDFKYALENFLEIAESRTLTPGLSSYGAVEVIRVAAIRTVMELEAEIRERESFAVTNG
jgi:hypothetical protein